MSDIIDPPKVFSLPIVECPSCGHGIDPHGIDPGGQCGVGDASARPCQCMWSPNDIAGSLLAQALRPWPDLPADD